MTRVMVPDSVDRFNLSDYVVKAECIADISTFATCMVNDGCFHCDSQFVRLVSNRGVGLDIKSPPPPKMVIIGVNTDLVTQRS